MPSEGLVLVVDDEENMRHMLSLLLSKEGYDVLLAENGEDAIAQLEQGGVDLILCDLRMPKMDGMAFLEACKSREPDATVIMMSAYGTVEIALDAMKKGAYDYIHKPFKPDEILLTLKKARERERLRRENLMLQEALGRQYAFENMVSKSRSMQEIFQTLRKVAAFPTTVLIQGESGTGKELIARAVHHNSDRAKKPFIGVNCAAIPEELMESELFGHVRGAFTDAVRDKPGMFVEADKGTLFLDEVGELPVSLQVKLLRVLQEKEVRPVGGEKSRSIDVRIVSATVKDLETEAAEGRFRGDLFYRLNVVTLKVPPLRGRPEDIPLLADHFIRKHRESLGVAVEGITQRAVRELAIRPWQGNVRELENEIERAMVMCEKRLIDVDDLKIHEGKAQKGGSTDASNIADLHLKRNLKAFEDELIRAALERTEGNRTRAAKLLGITHRALMYKLRDRRVDSKEKDPSLDM